MEESKLTISEKNEETKTVLNENIDKFPDEKVDRDKIITNIIELGEERLLLINKNRALQQKLSLFISGSSEKDYFQKLNFSDDGDEWSFKKLLDNITDKVHESKNISNKNISEIASLKEEVTQRSELLAERKGIFKAETEKAALYSVNSETGEHLTLQEVKEILQKEEAVSKTLEEYQLHSIQSRYNLNLVNKKKKNLAEGPLDFAEYEMMCIETQNNKEIIQPISEEIQNLLRKASNVINVLSHLGQKLYSAQKEKDKAQITQKILDNELNEMKAKLSEERTKYARMKRESKELQHKFILLQHPQLIEDYNNVMKENEEAQMELQRLKTIYETETKLINNL